MSRREGDDDYDNVILQLGPTERLIECADNWQWILQVRTGKRWRSVKFFTSRWGVLNRTRGMPGWQLLEQLPERFQSGCKDRLVRGPALSGTAPVQGAPPDPTLGSGHATD
jgi:hypothetical protein